MASNPIVSALRATAEPRAAEDRWNRTVSVITFDARNHPVHTDRIDVGAFGCPA